MLLLELLSNGIIGNIHSGTAKFYPGYQENTFKKSKLLMFSNQI